MILCCIASMLWFGLLCNLIVQKQRNKKMFAKEVNTKNIFVSLQRQIQMECKLSFKKSI